VNIVIRIDSPGNDGPVTQTNTSAAAASSGNTNQVEQGAQQTQVGGGLGSGQGQQVTQAAPTTQQANADAISTQVDALNVNIVIRNKSSGDEGPVSQTNTSSANAAATNANGVVQGSGQVQTGDDSSGGQSQSASQSAPTSQTADATASSSQATPTNAGVSISVDPSAPDPSGSGALGTLIQIWIPKASYGAAVAPSNTSVANATATNTSTVTQAADQTQKAGPAPPAQLGGSAQIQVVNQSAPTNQTANATASSTQYGAVSGSALATAIADSANHVTQTADQVQVGGSGGSQVQVIDQSAPTNQNTTATATATTQQGTSSSSATQTSSHDVSQGAEQRQVGGGSQVQVVEQSTGDGTCGDTRVGAGRRHGGGWVLAGSAGALFEPRLVRWGPGKPPGNAGSRPAPTRRHSTPQTPQLPLPPQAPVSLAAGVGGTGGGSLWVFAAVLIPFLLTAPWWARRQRSSAVRRLMGVVSRLERPG
jgi:hypothetical protein